jgi:predicted enzyme related to lactoylglutathione lyase
MDNKMETGTLCWFDLATKDEAKAKTFYKQVLGWEFEPMGKDYWMIKVGTQTIGGISKSQKFQTGDGMTAYFTVPSVKEGKTIITKAGGKLVGDNVAIGGGEHGYYQMFKDLDGNTLALWSKKP